MCECVCVCVCVCVTKRVHVCVYVREGECVCVCLRAYLPLSECFTQRIDERVVTAPRLLTHGEVNALYS